jgi:glycosyltransferase involved in cell wall biosynthesis
LAGIDKVICYSSKEAAYYTELFRAKTGKFVFVRFGVNVDRLNRIFSPASQDYVFAAGSSNRDYGTFFNAIKDLDTRVVVVAKRFNLHGHLIPKNVEVLYDVYGDQYYELLKNAQLIVIPLDDPELSSGQMVLLESMGLGKAVIASEVWGVSDYVDDGRNALLVPIHDCVRMKSAIEDLLKDAVRLGEMGVSARQSVQERFSAAEMAKGVSAELAQL